MVHVLHQMDSPRGLVRKWTRRCVCVCVGFVLLDVSACVGVLECLCFFPLFVCAGRGRLKSFRQQ